MISKIKMDISSYKQNPLIQIFPNEILYHQQNLVAKGFHTLSIMLFKKNGF